MIVGTNDNYLKESEKWEKHYMCSDIPSVVYFDQQMGAWHAVCWSKYTITKLHIKTRPKRVGCCF